MRADPEPHDDLGVDDPERAMAESHPCGVDGPGGVDVLEVEAWVVRIFLETAVGFTGPALDMIWWPAVGFAESAGRPRGQRASGSSGLVLPARCSARASSARRASAS